MWLCGYVAMKLCGYMAMWLCGYVAMWISSKIFKLFESHISKDNMFQDVPIYFLIFLGVFLIYDKGHKYGAHRSIFGH